MTQILIPVIIVAAIGLIAGLGLAIAKSYTEICNGAFEIVVDGDMFKAIIEFEKI